jgi:polar amino acid transport system substrate-binding protein
VAPTSTAPPAPTSTAPPPCDPTASIDPGDVEPAAAIAQLRDHDRLVVGVDQGTYGWGFRNTTTGDLSGLEVELLKRISREMFGDDRPIEFKTLTTANRITAVQHGDVDMVASLLTATCARWQQVDFSTVYFVAHQDVLVDEQSDIHTLEDLSGRTVCATRGSTSITNIARLVPKAKLHPVAARSDCLVALQDGTVDAITSDDTILRSFQRQELVPRTRQLGLDARATESEPYAIAVNRDHPELVRFVNRVLQAMRDDGSLRQLYTDWIQQPDTPFPAVSYR